MEKVILKDSTWLLLAQSITKFFSFFYVIFLARLLNINDFGNYIVAISYFTLISSIADFGISKYLIREISMNDERIKSFVPSAVAFRFLILLGFFLIFSVTLYFLDQDISRRNLSILAALAIFPQSVSFSIDATFLGLLKAKFSALGILIVNSTTIVVGVALVLLGFGSFGAIWGIIIGQLLFAFSLIVLAYLNGINWIGKVDVDVIKRIVVGSLPYGLLGIIGILYFKIDSLMISYLRGSYETGLYGAAYKFLESFVIIPSAISTILFPFLAKIKVDGFEKAKDISLKITKVIFPISLVGLIFFEVFLPLIIAAFLPKYMLSIPAMKILAISIPFIFLHVPLSQILLSNEKYLKSVLLFSLIPITVNILLNFIFIPIYGYIGAAWTTVFSDIVSFVVLLVFMYILLRKEIVLATKVN